MPITDLAARREYQRRYHDTHRQKYSARKGELRHQRPERDMLHRSRARARRRGVEFELTEGDITIPTHCPILGIALGKGEYVYGKGKRGPRPDSPSLDRIRPELGYVRGNVHVISHRANLMKNDATPQELRSFAEWIKRTFPDA